MFLRDLLFALSVALLLSFVFAGGFRRLGPWASLMIFFIIVFLAAWAGGTWLAPIGPRVWGGYWLPFFFVGLIFALFLAAAAPPRPPRYRGEALRQREAEKKVEKAMGIFLWVMIAFLVIAILSRYV